MNNKANDKYDEFMTQARNAQISGLKKVGIGAIVAAAAFVYTSLHAFHIGVITGTRAMTKSFIDDISKK